jgi:hypothetical protein
MSILDAIGVFPGGIDGSTKIYRRNAGVPLADGE